MTPVCTFGLNMRTIDETRVKVYIIGKVFLLGFQKFQNQSHRSYRKKLLWERPKLPCDASTSAQNATCPTSLREIASDLV